MHPADCTCTTCVHSNRPLSLDESLQLAGLLAEAGQHDLASDILTSALYDTAVSVLAAGEGQ
jgi:hypothetical protein